MGLLVMFAMVVSVLWVVVLVLLWIVLLLCVGVGGVGFFCCCFEVVVFVNRVVE